MILKVSRWFLNSDEVTPRLDAAGGRRRVLAFSEMLSRRQFLAWTAGVIPASVFVRRAHAAAIVELNAAPETLDALGFAILPSELGEAETRRVVAAFRRWLDGYKEGAELNHAYGSSRLTFAGPTPATRWMPQLDALEVAAQTTYTRAFAAVTLDQRRALVRDALASERATGMPAPDRATHVVTALLGFYFTSSQATDLCYLAPIGRNTCRPLARSRQRPA
jgi:hypothetical protein